MTEKSYLDSIGENIKRIRYNISEAAVKAGRSPEEVRLMAVTKTVEPVFINRAIECGIDLIGENRVQEFLSKRGELSLENVEAHFIGHLQTNKVRQIIGIVDMIQAVDSVRLAKEISKCSIKQSLTTKILLEVNIGGEESKFGFTPDGLINSVIEIAQFEGIEIKGMMTVPPISENPDSLRSFFSNLRQLFIDIEGKKLDNVNMSILSMGMSEDYVEAVTEGSTMVRVGSAIFGNRNYR
ncbi:MAG: YggS family pyridoxal phosphate-dependent enzyme [Clostridiales bacterium]|nr:YggS family pyridoxal phosphate-dependent enzyme [Clostridiales bacterium]